MSRLQRIREAIFAGKRELSLERARLYLENWQKSQDQPVIIRRAMATAHILDGMEITINPGELIVGGRTVKPRSGVASPEMSVAWLDEELSTLATRPQDPFVVTEDDQELFRSQLLPYWQGQTLKDIIFARLPDSVRQASDAGVVKLNQTDKGQGHIIIEFELALERGIGALLAEAEHFAASASGKQEEFYRAAAIALAALNRFILRYQQLAEELALTSEDATRRQELEQIAENARLVATEPPQTFWQALQLFWFVNVAAQVESNASSISSGRFDQFMNRFYRQDREQGTLSEEAALELLECLWLKMNEIVMLRSSDSARYFAGFPTGYTIILGGLDQRGRDATNELSYLCLQATANQQLPQPNVGIRLHSRTPDQFLRDSCAVIKLGFGMPQVFNDEAVIPALLNRGVDIRHARDYSVVGCVELSLPGRMYGLHDIALFNLLKVLELTVQDGWCPVSEQQFERNQQDVSASFEALLAEVRRRIDQYVELMVQGSNIVDAAHGELAPTPLLSVFVNDCMAQGKDVSRGGAMYNFSGVQGIGIANLSDSLAVLRDLVYEKKQMPLNDLAAILRDNFLNQEVLRQTLVHRYPKYGNDVDAVDDLGCELLRHYCLEVEKYTNPRGGIFQPGIYTVSAHIPLGAAVGATPDGRMSGSQLADGGLSAMVGLDLRGPTALLNSVAKVDSTLISNGSLLNLKFSPALFSDERGLAKMSSFLRAFVNNKIQHIQFNIVDGKTLRQAQQNPSEFPNLVVRVAGYSAFFTELSRDIQEDIIARTEHSL